MQMVTDVKELFERKWHCLVFHSGTHNGVYCGPDDPHGGEWGCGYRWVAPPLTDTEADLLGLPGWRGDARDSSLGPV